ncbi:MAG TPA: hypothetical protein VGV59_09970 [Pyrinomonadaceae bacterium]|nr:hypothetical protein [Pyrinomonadaceae bacterium]
MLLTVSVGSEDLLGRRADSTLQQAVYKFTHQTTESFNCDPRMLRIVLTALAVRYLLNGVTGYYQTVFAR